MKIEVCEDDLGWKWLMPKLSKEEALTLGTWDLADWTYGTREFFEHATWNEDYKLPIYAKPFWVIENILRFLDWYLYLRSKRGIVYGLVSKMRSLVYDVAWKIS